MQQHSVCFTFGQNNELLRGEKGAKLSLPLWAMPQRKLFVDGGVPLYLKILFKTTQALYLVLENYTSNILRTKAVIYNACQKRME